MPLNSTLNYPIGVQVDAQLAPINTHLTTLDSQISTIQSNITSLTTRVSAAESSIIDLQNRMSVAESNINSNSVAISGLTTRVSNLEVTVMDLDRRITALETGGSAIPRIGSIVHLRDNYSHCQPAIVYENWTFINGRYCMSVIVVEPERLEISPWRSKIEVEIEPTPAPANQPFNYWHWPESPVTPSSFLYDGIRLSANIR